MPTPPLLFSGVLILDGGCSLLLLEAVSSDDRVPHSVSFRRRHVLAVPVLTHEAHGPHGWPMLELPPAERVSLLEEASRGWPAALSFPGRSPGVSLSLAGFPGYLCTPWSGCYARTRAVGLLSRGHGAAPSGCREHLGAAAFSLCLSLQTSGAVPRVPGSGT